MLHTFMLLIISPIPRERIAYCDDGSDNEPLLLKVLSFWMMSGVVAISMMLLTVAILVLYEQLKKEKTRRDHFINRDQDTPVALAAKYDHIATVDFLLIKGAKAHELQRIIAESDGQKIRFYI